MSAGARWLLGMTLAGWALLAIGVWSAWPAIAMLADPDRSRAFYIPSQSMMPTLAIGDRIRPKLASPAELRRGAVIVFQGAETARVDRVVGLGGDAVALRAGRVLVNGQSAQARVSGLGPLLDGQPTHEEIERLPGEAHCHRILDTGQTVQDDFGPVRVPDGALFVLGDARDNAADGRFPQVEGGVGFVPVDKVIGVVDRLWWAAGFRSLGRAIDPLERCR